jgi:hypothetical protein
MLKCGLHTCPQYCHNLYDHSKMVCTIQIKSVCPQKHTMVLKCHEMGGTKCQKCEAEARKKEKRIQRDLDLEKEREARQKAYADELAELQAEIEHEKQYMKRELDDQERQNVLAQHRQDLEKLRKAKEAAKHHASSPQVPSSPRIPIPKKEEVHQEQEPPGSPPTILQNTDTDGGGSNIANETSWNQSDARDDWNYQKNLEGQENEALDELVEMIGKYWFQCVVDTSNFSL